MIFYRTLMILDIKLTISRSKDAESYYVQKSYRTDSSTSSTRTVGRLVSIEDVKARFGVKNTMETAKAYIRELTKADKEQSRDVIVKLLQGKMIRKGEQHCPYR